jgi:hypothetical protein
MARLGAGDLDAAREDYEQLLKQDGSSEPALFGLAAVAWRKLDTNSAIELYQRYLSCSSPDTPQSRVAHERLAVLKKGRVH